MVLVADCFCMCWLCCCRTRTATPLALVLVPTHELAQQIEDQACKFAQGLKDIKMPVAVYGGLPAAAMYEKLERGVHFLVATPGRLIDVWQRGTLLMYCTLM